MSSKRRDGLFYFLVGSEYYKLIYIILLFMLVILEKVKVLL